MEVLSPYETLTKDLTEEIKVLSAENTVDPEDTLDSILTLLSDPSVCAEVLNLYVPTPTDVDPNPTNLPLTRISLVELFVKSRLNTPLSIEIPNDPIRPPTLPELPSL